MEKDACTRDNGMTLDDYASSPDMLYEKSRDEVVGVADNGG